MGNSLRCCLACMLPCGALDVVRIVHLNGRVDEYSRQVFAGEILAANPNHILSKPCSQGVVRQIMRVSPESELRRGHIYFLIPSSSLRQKKKNNKKKPHKKNHSKSNLLVMPNQDNYLAEILSEKNPSHHRGRRSVRVAVWRPRLEAIAEEA